jgi:transposase
MVKKGGKKSMRTIREILRLHFEHQLSQRAIARACSVSPTTVGEYLELALKVGLDWPEVSLLDDAALKRILLPEEAPPPPRRPMPDLAAIQKELTRKGVTLQLLWEEYRAVHPDGYGRTQFFELYRAYARTLHPVMRFTHKAGDKLFVDFSGNRPGYVNRDTGEVIEAELFVAVMGASDFIFAVAVPNQQTPNWLKAHVAGFEYLGGCPACVVPDQLKQGVKTSCRYDPEINPAYADLAAHYGVVVLPARPAKPRDKAKVENGVLNAQRRILAALRDRTFFSLPELNVAIAEELEKLNDRPMKGSGKSRRQLFEELDRPELKPLPNQRFQMRQWQKAKVNIDYHIAADWNFYSVPYSLIGKEVEVCLTGTTVEVLRNGERIASHLRSYRRGVYVTDNAHRPPSHQKYLEWTPERIRRWGESIGPQTGAMIDAIITATVHSEHAFRKCLGLLRLSKTYGADRLELACSRALGLKAISYQSVKNILKKGLEASELPESLEPQLSFSHDNVRGSDYYAGGTI